MNPILYAIPVFLLTIVIEAAIAWRRRQPVYDVADAITSLHFGVLSQVAGAFTRALTIGLYVLVYERFRATELPADSPWVWLLALLLYDFLYYWVHRFGHEVNLMWAAHQVHHSSEYYNLTTALRQTSTGAAFGWPFYLPMAVIGVPPEVFIGASLIDLLYQYWVHTELVGKLGWLDRVLVTPSNHRVHHGQNDYCIDRNYGGILILWDRLFGTFVDEREGEKIVYGIRKPLASYNPLWGNFNVYVDIGRGMRAARGWRAKLAVLFAPPGGWNEPVPPLDTRSVNRFAVAGSPWLSAYAVLQYLIMVVMICHFLVIAPQLSTLALLLYAGAIVAAAVTVGGLLERKAWARVAEALRLLLSAGTVLLLVMMGADVPGVVPMTTAGQLALSTVVVAFVLLSLLWLRRLPNARVDVAAPSTPAMTEQQA